MKSGAPVTAAAITRALEAARVPRRVSKKGRVRGLREHSSGFSVSSEGGSLSISWSTASFVRGQGSVALQREKLINIQKHLAKIGITSFLTAEIKLSVSSNYA